MNSRLSLVVSALLLMSLVTSSVLGLSTNPTAATLSKAGVSVEGKGSVNGVSPSNEYPQVIGFSSAYWQCHDGTELTSSYFCSSSELWQKNAVDFCTHRCSIETGKCGVNSFLVFDQCPYDGGSKPITPTEGIPVGKDPDFWDAYPEKNPDRIPTETGSPHSCILDGKTFPLGYRKEGLFCSEENTFIAQFTENGACNNNFECSSNVCVNSYCISPGTIQKMLSWFNSLF